MVKLHRHNWPSLKTLFEHHMQSSEIFEKDHGQTIDIIRLVLKLCFPMMCNLQELLNMTMVQLLRHNWLSPKTVFDHHMESS